MRARPCIYCDVSHPVAAQAIAELDAVEVNVTAVKGTRKWGS